jgi:hypothetical protein
MRITVKLFGKATALEMDANQTVKDIKFKIKQLNNIEVEQQRLIYLKDPLDYDFKTLQECKIKDGSVLYLKLRLFIKKEH